MAQVPPPPPTPPPTVNATHLLPQSGPTLLLRPPLDILKQYRRGLIRTALTLQHCCAWCRKQTTTTQTTRTLPSQCQQYNSDDCGNSAQGIVCRAGDGKNSDRFREMYVHAFDQIFLCCVISCTILFVGALYNKADLVCDPRTHAVFVPTDGRAGTIARLPRTAARACVQ